MMSSRRTTCALEDHDLSTTVDTLKNKTIMTNKWANRKVLNSEFQECLEQIRTRIGNVQKVVEDD